MHEEFPAPNQSTAQTHPRTERVAPSEVLITRRQKRRVSEVPGQAGDQPLGVIVVESHERRRLIPFEIRIPGVPESSVIDLGQQLPLSRNAPADGAADARPITAPLVELFEPPTSAADVETLCECGQGFAQRVFKRNAYGDQQVMVQNGLGGDDGRHTAQARRQALHG